MESKVTEEIGLFNIFPAAAPPCSEDAVAVGSPIVSFIMPITEDCGRLNRLPNCIVDAMLLGVPPVVVRKSSLYSLRRDPWYPTPWWSRVMSARRIIGSSNFSYLVSVFMFKPRRRFILIIKRDLYNI